MGAYILRRLALMVPTLLGIMVINFFLIQFVPGGPIEQVISQLDQQSSATDRFSGGGDETGRSGSDDSSYQGAKGLPPGFVDELRIQFSFARLVCEEGYTGTRNVSAAECVAEDIGGVERFFLMMGKYLRFDFGESYFKSKSVVDLVIEKMPVSITLGLWSTLIAYLVSIPLGIRKAVRDGSRFDTWTSAMIIVGYAIPGFLFAILLLVLFAGGSYWQLFPLRGLTSDNYEELSMIGKVLDYLWHITLPVLASTISAFATLTLLTKNSFLDEINKQYVTTAMLIIISGFPALFVAVFFGGSLIIETIFSLDGLGRLGFEAVVNRDYPVVFGTLFAFSLIGLVVGLLSDLTYMLIDPRIDFEARQI